MKLGFFTMPIHPLDKDWRQSLREDREAFVLADQLGFVEGYVGEHVTDRAENITSCVTFIASLVDATKSIKLGTGTINMSNHHPARVASEVAMVDNMAEGRFIMGISPGGLLSDAEIFENIDKDRQAMFLEAIDTVLAIWEREPPYNIRGKFWNVSTERSLFLEVGQGQMVRPYQKPHPPIVVTVVAPFSKGVTEAAARGWDPISANFLLPKWVKSHWPKYVEGCEKSGREAKPENWRVAKSIFVADDLDTARRYATGSDGPYWGYFEPFLAKLIKHGRSNLFKVDPKAPDSSLTPEKAIADAVIWGTPEKVTEELLAFRDEIGDFGTLLYCSHDWVDPKLAKRSMELMAEKVMPAVNRAIASPRKVA
jgi:alkanesulfonate monooxygenase SsuD/methylene tetrahydromethanopterin reductase-like flavin-dependent oxidoreductase (luciferase family)